ncbi:MAG: aminoacyl-histidine dipeptidase [Candidatus Marinimicrobia bacterium]|jgi:dipeptidase D|nr:aminoacyl-histidine dipeptidase [Candidatus Neomarinimicrobiota bacterium]
MNKKIEDILELFQQINNIPRCSKNEEKISNWLVNWAKEQKLEVVNDEVKNVLIKVPATKGLENRQTIVIQGHMDMVCEKTPDSSHDFSKDPIENIIDGDWLHANHTTLGADNGVALAFGMEIARDKNIVHPPLELLFTVDEETGLTGANALRDDFLDGRILLNFDSEQEGIFTIGCAGGKDTEISLPLNYEEIPNDFKLYKIEISGLMGGHSGQDITAHRANANKVLARVLQSIKEKYFFNIVNLSGGTAHNAIPRDSHAIISFKSEHYENIKEIVQEIEKVIQAEFADTEKSIKIKLMESNRDYTRSFTKDTTEKAIDLILALPHGIKDMSLEFKKLPETSCNLAVLEVENDSLKILSSQRSSKMSVRDYLTKEIEAVAKLSGAEYKSSGGYSSWRPNTDSKLLEKCKNVYKQKFGKEAEIEVVHGGLECGVIGAKYEGMDMISIGPTIENPHSPQEKLHIPSIIKFWDFVCELLKSF